MENAVRFAHLLKKQFFDGMKSKQKAALLELFEPRIYDEDELILSQGIMPQGFFMLAHGAIEVTSTAPSGQMIIIRICTEGELVGAFEALGETECAADCTVRANSTVLFLPNSRLSEALEMPYVMRNLFRNMTSVFEHDNFFKGIDQSHSMDYKIAAYLLKLTQRNGAIEANQGYLAEYVGCSRQKMNRYLGELRDQGIVELRKGKVTVTDRPRLEQELQKQ